VDSECPTLEIMVTALQIHEHLLSLDGGWVDRSHTTDRVIAGDPDRETTGIAVGWMSYTWALQRALDLGCNVFVTHEPTFFSGFDDDERIFRFPGVRVKRHWIEERGITVVRCHDVWDQLPEIGIADSWPRFLGLPRPIAADGFFRLCDVTGRTAGEIAALVAARTAPLGQEAVQLIGNPETRVSRLATGTGAITSLPRLLDRFAADMAICTDDGFTYWHAGALAIDLGIPVVVVNHAVSELHGIELLAAHLAREFTAVPVRHIPQRCMYALVRP
jgi:putative NIF3 family GTP cyclohydrolase 1 type 2